MRHREFTDWLGKRQTKNGRLSDSTIETYEEKASTIEFHEKIKLDDEFKKDGLKRLIDLYKYSKEDETNNRPNPTSMPDYSSSLSSFLSNCRTVLNHYKNFCKDHPPI